MASVLILLPGAGCGSDDPVDPPFSETGGTLEIDGCDYSITTRLGAEPPRVATSTVGIDPTPRLVHLGIVGDPSTSIVAQWRTVDETTTATTIRYALGDNLTEDQLTEQATGIQFGYRSTGTAIYRMHQAHLCGLTPGTTYSYQVGSEGHFSPVYSFTTAPDVVANPDAEVVFGVVGDSRAGYDVWSQIVAQFQQRSPDMILFTGDAVTLGITQFEWEEFFGRAEPLFARVPVVAAHGNHEVNAVNFFSQLAMPGDQEMFGFDYGHAHITVANDTPDDITNITGAFRDAIAADFEASKDARWKLLMHHQSMFSAAMNHGSSVFLQETWQPLVDQYHLDLVLAGHDHDYEISKPLIGQTVQTSNANATVYVVAGGAGAELYGNGMLFHTAYSESTHSAAVLRVRRDLMELEAFRPDGTAIAAPEAHFTKTK
ncbi:MAG TPA: metallophosphoesterase family protein [Kofleriaceae bacterium]|nr:metallophosphoesterase family protein [Kofleriaceae bacterium]